MIVIFLLLALVGLMAWFTISVVRRHGAGIVAQRGSSTGADLGALRDQPRVRISSVLKVGPDRFRITLAPAGPEDDESIPTELGLELVVSLNEDEFGFELLHEWKRSGTPLAIVVRPDTRVVRLRSLDDLQPLTLRRVDE